MIIQNAKRHFRIVGRYGVFIAAALLLCTSCATDDGNEKKDETKQEEKDKEKKDDRFAFLRREEKDHPTASRPAAKSESDEAGSDAFKPRNPVSDEQLKSLEKDGKKEPEAPTQPTEVKGGRKAPRKTFYDDFIALNGDEELPVSLIFNSAPLLDVLSAFADILGFNFVADSDLKSVVTLNLNSTMTRRDLWNTFDRMLYVAGATARVDDSLIRIMARNKLAGQPDQQAGDGKNSNILYFPLTTATAREATIQLRPFLAPGGVCIELSRPNAIMVCDTPENMEKLRQILECIDRNGRQNWPRAVMSCRNVLPNKLITELQEVLPVLGFYVVKPNDRTEPPGSVQLIGLDRLGVIVASAATKEAIDEIRKWIELLDTADSDDQERVFVYKVRHTKASNLARALAVIYEVQGTSLYIDTDNGRTRLETVNSQVNRAATGNRTTASSLVNRGSHTAIANQATNLQTDAGSNLFTNITRVFADGTLNRLVIRTTPRTYASIKALLDRLDVVPAQVLLQVLVVEVTLSESTQFGLEFSGHGTGNDITSLFGTNYASGGGVLNPFTTEALYNEAGDVIGTQSNVAMGDKRQTGGTFYLGKTNDPQGRFGYIRALAGNGLVKVISCPQILVSSHTKASIQVGSQVPVITSTYTSTSSNGSTQNSVDYKETGIILTVTPQVTSTDLISLEVKQELSQAITNSSSSIDSPEITKRTVQTAMTIADGHTMIIGGLIQEKKNDNLDSLPFINKIPLLNRLAGNTNAAVERSEVLVMVTGYIVDEHSPVEDMIKRYNDAIEALNAHDRTLGDRPDANDSKPKLMTDPDFWL